MKAITDTSLYNPYNRRDKISVDFKQRVHCDLRVYEQPVDCESVVKAVDSLTEMKDKSKNAARTRREKENHEFAELAKLLPLPHSVTNQLDKASVIRLTTSYLKMREIFPAGLGDCWGSKVVVPDPIGEISSQILSTLEGFVFVVTREGKILYVSETVASNLGLDQRELTGNLVYEYLDPRDMEEMRHILDDPNVLAKYHGTSGHAETCGSDLVDIEIPRTFCLRFKCVLAKRNAGLTNDGFKAIHCTGYTKIRWKTDEPSWQNLALVATGYSYPSSPSTELKMYRNMYMSRHDLNLKTIFLDSAVTELTNYSPQELLEKTVYQFVHPADILGLRESHELLEIKGQATTKYYRFLCKGGGWVWMQSHIIMVNNARASRTKCIVSVNCVISEIQERDTILGDLQLSVPLVGNSCAAIQVKCSPSRNSSSPASLVYNQLESSEDSRTSSCSFSAPNASANGTGPEVACPGSTFRTSPSASGTPTTRATKVRAKVTRAPRRPSGPYGRPVEEINDRPPPDPLPLVNIHHQSGGMIVPLVTDPLVDQMPATGHPILLAEQAYEPVPVPLDMRYGPDYGYSSVEVMGNQAGAYLSHDHHRDVHDFSACATNNILHQAMTECTDRGYMESTINPYAGYFNHYGELITEYPRTNEELAYGEAYSSDMSNVTYRPRDQYTYQNFGTEPLQS
ncbi:Protein single-minded [Halotydeus destructor]|nr:Protein single-minded [Halotydeus destructor]